MTMFCDRDAVLPGSVKTSRESLAALDDRAKHFVAAGDR